METVEKHDKKLIGTSLPSIQVLFVDSWNLFTSRLLRFLFFALIQVGFFTLLFLVLFIIGANIFVTSIMPLYIHHTTINFSALFPSLLIGGICIFIAMFLIGLTIGAVSTAWQLLVLNEPAHVPFSVLFRKGFSYIVPLISISVVLSVITLGGFFFFFVPVILFAIFFAFSQYEVVYEKQSTISALKQSYLIVTTHFGDIFVRMFLLWIISVFLSLLPSLVQHINSLAAVNLRSLLILIDIGLGWYSVCYSYVLYLQARQRTDLTKHVTLTWVWVLSGIGWLFFVIFLVVIVFIVIHFASSPQTSKALWQLYQNSMSPTAGYHAMPNEYHSPRSVYPPTQQYPNLP